MMRIINLIFPFIFIGCVTRTEYKVVYKTKRIYVKPPKVFFRSIKTPKPPDRDKFIEATPIERELMLGKYSIDLLYTIKKYKERNNELLRWYKKIEDKGK